MKPSSWPSLDEQFAAANVVRGSALEQLIRDNQDFSLLQPSEAHDDIGLPPWLRVHWRKNHPEYSNPNPVGVYPDVVYNIHTWMLLHQDLRGGPPTAPAKHGAPPDAGKHAATHGGKRGAR